MNRSDVAIARRAFRQLWIPATVWALAFGATIASSALTYVSSFPTAASRQLIAETTGRDKGLAILLGPVSAIDSVGGYTVYKCYAFLTTIGAVWALLAATRLLRGEEDTGRWQLLLAGSTRAARATIATLVALGLAISVLFVGTTLITLLAGRDPDLDFGVGETVLYGLSLTIAPAVFAGIGAVAAQLSRTRRMAAGLGMGVLGASFVVRMIADSSPSTRWLLWVTPFGWTERIRPFTENDVWPLLVAGAVVVVLCVTATFLAARRDAGEGVLAAPDVSALRPFGLRSPLGLALRLDLPMLAAWCAGVAAGALSLGIVAKVVTGTLPESFTNTLERFGVRGSFVHQYLGVAFLIVAAVVALLPASQIAAATEEETSRRLVHVLAQPTNRARLLAGRLAFAGAGVVAAALLAGLAGWVGARSQGVDLGLMTAVGAGLNVVPTALIALGVGAVFLAVAPRVAAGAVYAVVIWSLLIDLVGTLVSSASWLEYVSLFHFMALAPAQDPDATTLVVSVGLAVALCAAATILFDRRDVHAG